MCIDGSLCAEIYIEEAREAGEMLCREIGRMLADAELDAADLTGLGVLTGPGSYTGLRLGLALVRGLAFADRLPVAGIDTLELLYRMADCRDPDPTFCAVMPANRGRLYAAAY